MKVVVIGLGIQGRKRMLVADGDVVATVDPVMRAADYQSLAEVREPYDAALLCVPDEAKAGIIAELIAKGKHVLVEKPLFVDERRLTAIEETAIANRCVCYTAYNHRFEPHFVRAKTIITEGTLGKIYHCRMFYGNGTARDVRSSPWRDQGAGVLTDLGSHLLDTVAFWFGYQELSFTLLNVARFENKAPDHVMLQSVGEPHIVLEASLLSWRNDFQCDILAENGSLHLRSLCKWGPASLTLRRRRLPSGRPDEETVTLVGPDPTWEVEYNHFKQLVAEGRVDLRTDRWIANTLGGLAASIER